MRVTAIKTIISLPIATALLAAGLLACGPVSGEEPDGGNQNHSGLDGSVTGDASAGSDAWVYPDSGPRDAGNVYLTDGAPPPDGCTPEPCQSPISGGCQTSETCGNGLDDDCNGDVDDTCTCVPGSVQECFKGEPNRANVGACQMGTQTCLGNQEFGFWGPCENGIWPSAEVCDELDNDCNGCVDDNLCCGGELTCPDPTQIPDAQPFTSYQLDGTQWYSGAATGWSWTVEGGPCDAVLGDQFTINGANTATPTLEFTLSGDYTVTMTVQTPNGPQSCTFIVHVTGPGLRVELCWEGTGSRDLDLHLLREDLGADWCDLDNDCYYMNCKATSPWDMGTWGYADGPLNLCEGGPEGVPSFGGCALFPNYWSCRGSCANPRLDIDNISTPGLPENVNVDAPADGETFRIMTHYYGGSGEAYPVVNIYCDGHRVATYGQAPGQVTGFDTSGTSCGGNTWRVADVTTSVQGGVTTCTVDALHPPGQSSGFYIRSNSSDYN